MKIEEEEGSEKATMRNKSHFDNKTTSLFYVHRSHVLKHANAITSFVSL